MRRLLPFLLIVTAAFSQSTTAVVPPQFFGLHWYYGNPYPVVPFGSMRLWDTNATRWQVMNTAANTYNFTNLDNVLSTIKTNGTPTDVLLTLGQTPNFISSDASNSSCGYSSFANGSCGVPTDIAASCTNVNTLNNCDGKTDGTNQTWRSYIYNLATHIAGLSPSTYQTVTSVEIWNEFTFQSGAAFDNWEGTDAQLVRMSQDANCIFTGRGVITSQGNLTCTAAHMGVAAVGIIPSMVVMTPDSQMASAPQTTNWGLYVATAGALPSMDVAAVHTYTASPSPTVAEKLFTQFTTTNGFLVTAGSSCALMPLGCWSTEGSWGTNSSLEPDLDLQAAFVARYYLNGWAAGFKRMYWYAYTANNVGTLWVANGSGGCVLTNGCLTKAGVAYQTIYNWMVGQAMSNLCSNVAGTTWTCLLANPGSIAAARVVWDTSQTCSGGSCGTVSYTIPSNTYASYSSLDGTTTAISSSATTVPVGAKPIRLNLLAGGSSVTIAGGVTISGGVGGVTFSNAPPPLCAPPNYCAQTNTTFAALPAVPPQMGANTCTAGSLQNCGNGVGAGTTGTDPNFNSQVSRVTDNTYYPPLPDDSFVVDSGGSADEMRMSCDDNKIVIDEADGARHLPMNFVFGQPGQRMYSTVPAWTTFGGFFLNTGATFWGHNCPSAANIMYNVSNGVAGAGTAFGSLLGHYDFTNQAVVPSFATDFDFKGSLNCLGAGFTVTWMTNGGSDITDTNFAFGYSNNGGQGQAGAIYIVYWRRGFGCRVLNTSSDTVTGDWGSTGPTTGGSCTGTIHNVKLSKDGNWIVWSIISASAGCSAGGANSQQWEWNAPGLTLQPIAFSNGGGHFTEKLTLWANNAGNNNPNYMTVRPFANVTSVTGVVPSFPSSGVSMDWHLGDNSGIDAWPFFGTSALFKGDPVTTAWQNELIGFQPITGGKQYRFAQLENTAVNQYFSGQYAISSCSQDGRYCLFTSDWRNTLGSESGTAACIPNGPNWFANKVYSGAYIPFIINPSAGNPGNFSYQTTLGGTSGATEPGTWNQTVGGTQVDGTVSWTNIGGPPSCRVDVFVVDMLSAH